MGNPKFKLTNMIQNAWFYKLRHLNNNHKSSKSHSIKLNSDHLQPPPPPPPPPPQLPPPQPSSTLQTTIEPPICQARKSYHITRELPNNPPQNFPPFSPPRRSKPSTKSRKSSTRTNSMSSSSSKSTTSSLSYPSKSNSPSSPPIFGDPLLKNEQFFRDINTFDFKLPPIITKQERKLRYYSSKEEKIIAPIIKEHKKISPSPKRFQEKGMRLNVNSPRIMRRKQGQNGNFARRSTSSKKRRSISESFAVVKSSFDPQKDFKESMMEMIVQHNLRGSQDLEDLLACYLSLNADEYHDVIINVFKQIWFYLRHQKHIA